MRGYIEVLLLLTVDRKTNTRPMIYPPKLYTTSNKLSVDAGAAGYMKVHSSCFVRVSMVGTKAAARSMTSS